MRFDALAKAALIIAVALAAGLRVAAGDEWDRFKRLVHAAYFADECRREAETLGVPRSTDPAAWVAAINRRMADGLTAAPSLDRRLAGASLREHCTAPLIVLINALRSNGVDAVVTVVAGPDDPASNIADGFVVYVPALDRYFDPTLAAADQFLLDSAVRDRPPRMYFYGPSLPSSRDFCADLCLRVMARRRN